VAGFLTTSSILMCPHGGQVQAVTSNTRAKAGGDFMLRASDTFTIVGCPFVVGIPPHPCVRVQWVQPSERTQVMSDFALTEESVGLCVAADMAVQGTVQVLFTQPRVSGTG
jgi:hypothetical protein